MRAFLDGSIRYFTLFEVIFRDISFNHVTRQNTDSEEAHLTCEGTQQVLTN